MCTLIYLSVHSMNIPVKIVWKDAIQTVSGILVVVISRLMIVIDIVYHVYKIKFL